MWKTSRLVSLACVLAAGAFAQEKQPEAPRPADAAATKSPALQKLLAASPEERSPALIAFLEEQIATRATYAGQYSGLAGVEGDVAGALHKWAIDAPLEATNADDFRGACIHALRDVLGKKAPDDVLETMREIARDEFESRALRNLAGYALAQFGDRSLVDASIKRAEEAIKAEDPRQQADGYSTLANVHYNLRDYPAAVQAYKGLIGLHEAKKVTLTGAATAYYNCACSMALGGNKDEALQYLEKALALGTEARQQLPRTLLESDMDIASLREDPRFAALLAKHFDAGQPAKDKEAPPPAEKGGKGEPEKGPPK